MNKTPVPTYLEWADAFNTSGWHNAEELEKFCRSDLVVRECGFVVRETRQYIVFATGHKPEDEQCYERWLGLHKIPKTWIKKRKVLNIR